MRDSLLAKKAAAAAFSAVMSVTAATGTITGTLIPDLSNTAITAVAAESSVKVLSAVGYGEGTYLTWSSVSGASGYNVYVDGKKIDLTVTEWRILEAFIKNRGNVLTREQLIEISYPDDTYLNDRAIDCHIKRLRKKLPENSIETVYGLGYRF